MRTLIEAFLLGLILSVFSGFCLQAHAQDQTATIPASAPAAAVGSNPADLEARIRVLEHRLNELTNPDVAKKQNSTTLPKTASVENSNKETSTQPTKIDDGGLQAAFIFRDSAPTLDKNKFEVGVETNYTRSVSFLQSDRIFFGSMYARYGFGNGFELGVTVPYYKSVRETQAINSFTNEITSWGDAQVQLLKQLWAPTESYFGAALMGGIVLPTGRSPYNFSGTQAYQPGQDPRDFFQSVQSRGHWAAIGNLQFYKIFDPVILFFGLGIDYAFEKDVVGYKVQPGVRYNYNFGFSFAISEYTTFGAQIQGSFETELVIDGDKVAHSAAEQARGRITLIQRVEKDLFVEPSVVLGLTSETPSLTVGLTLRKRM